jgi:sirohydrochlorin cobaltochelatase
LISTEENEDDEGFQLGQNRIFVSFYLIAKAFCRIFSSKKSSSRLLRSNSNRTHSTCAQCRLLNVSSMRSDFSALLIVAHGSTVNPDSSAPTLAHTAEIRRRKIFADVECAFWKEEPSLRDALFLIDPESIREVCVVPNFISEGYFTQTVIPRELELTGPTTERSNGQIWKYCEPVGNHPMMTELLLKRARDIAPDVDSAETSLLIVAHGTDLNENSAVAAKREAEKIRALGNFAAVLNVYMEEPPLVSDWRKLTKTRNVVVVPFFISDGLHSYEDIPRLIGITNGRSSTTSRVVRGEIFRGNPYRVDGRSLFYAPSIGTDPGFAEIIVEQAGITKS